MNLLDDFRLDAPAPARAPRPAPAPEVTPVLLDVATLSPRAQRRLAEADPAIVAFAATMPGGVAAWAEAPLLDGHGRVVDETPREPGPFDADLVDCVLPY